VKRFAKERSIHPLAGAVEIAMIDSGISKRLETARIYPPRAGSLSITNKNWFDLAAFLTLCPWLAKRQ